VDKFKAKWKGLGHSNNDVDLKREEIEQLIVQLILDHVLKEEFQHTAYSTNAYVTLGPLWKPALQGKIPDWCKILLASADGLLATQGTDWWSLRLLSRVLKIEEVVVNHPKAQSAAGW
jgi:hypothetical protein